MIDATKMLFGVPQRRPRAPVPEPELEIVTPGIDLSTIPVYHTLLNLNDLQPFIEKIKAVKICAFDFETAPLDEYRDQPKAALDPHRSDVVGVSLACEPGRAVYLPCGHRNEKNIVSVDELLALLAAFIFFNKSIIKICQNMPFESAFLYKHGIVLQPPVYDTICASQMSRKGHIFRDLYKSGLKTLSKELLGKDQLTFQEVTGGKHFDELDPTDHDVRRYACEDADFALQLYQYFGSWFEQAIPKHQTVVQQLESPTAVGVGMMKYNGICVDREYLEAQDTEARIKIDGLVQEIQELLFERLGENYGVQTGLTDAFGEKMKGLNLNSTQQLARVLFDELKLPVVKLTEKGKPSTDDEVLKKLRKQSPQLAGLFNALLAYRKWMKLRGTYILGLIDAISPVTEKIHTDFLQLLTETGRFSSRNPNLQNLPRASNDPVGIRKAFLPSPGHVLISFDFSQIELRVAAYYSQDKNMLEVYRTGKDIHAQTAALIYGIETGTESKEQRTVAKAVNFGFTYGLTPPGLQTDLEITAGVDKSLKECEAIINGFERAYPGLRQYQQEIIQLARKQGYVETFFGRRRYLPAINAKDARRSFAERMAMNTPIQGTAADILKRAFEPLIIGLRNRPWLRPLLQIHDELLFEAPEDRKDEAAVFIKKCMERPVGGDFNVPIKSDGSWGYDFANQQKFEAKR